MTIDWIKLAEAVLTAVLEAIKDCRVQGRDRRSIRAAILRKDSDRETERAFERIVREQSGLGLFAWLVNKREIMDQMNARREAWSQEDVDALLNESFGAEA